MQRRSSVWIEQVVGPQVICQRRWYQLVGSKYAADAAERKWETWSFVNILQTLVVEKIQPLEGFKLGMKGRCLSTDIVDRCI